MSEQLWIGINRGRFDMMGEDLAEDLEMLVVAIEEAVGIVEGIGERMMDESGDIPEELMRIRSSLIDARRVAKRMIEEEK